MRILWHVAFALLLGTAIAFAHGEYDWIRKGKYRSPKWGMECCGPEDCRRIRPQDVAVVPGGYKIGYQFYAWSEVLPSEDGDYWGCGDAASGYLCLFVPLGV